MPLVARPHPGRFWLGTDTPVHAERGAEVEAAAVRRVLPVLAVPPERSADAPDGDGSIYVGRAKDLATEAYRLFIGPNRVRVEAGGPAGAYYAAQTLRQLVGDDAWRAVPAANLWAVPCAEVRDAPVLAWRGAHLDVARHFFPKQTLLDFIDVIAAHKLNRLHLHLTDDQGWRVESRRYPALHEVGSYRPRTMVSLASKEAPAYDDTPHGGYYTLADLSEVAAYAAQRMVTVVPAIDVPGHTSALLAALPEFGCGPATDYEVATEWGIFDRLVSPLPKTVDFLAEVLDELLGAVPARYVHIGGDEAVLDRWRQDAEVEDYRRSLGLVSAEALHAHFLRELADVLAGYGARAVVWDEGFTNAQRVHTDEAQANTTQPPQTRLRPDTVVMAWHGMQTALRAAAAGHDVVVTPEDTTYFDHDQADDDREPLAITGPTRAEAVAGFRPVPPDWPAEAATRVLGTQFQLWTEYIPDRRALEYMAFPRACVLAEVAWTGAAVPWASLRPRLAAHLGRLAALGVEYRPLEGPRPWQEGGTGLRRHRRPVPLTTDAHP